LDGCEDFCFFTIFKRTRGSTAWNRGEKRHSWQSWHPVRYDAKNVKKRAPGQKNGRVLKTFLGFLGLLVGCVVFVLALSFGLVLSCLRVLFPAM
jgi:hypothetical protein